MSILATRGAISARNYGLFGAIPAAYQISRSLRFRASNSAYLSRTFGAGSQSTWTWSGWVKRSNVGGNFVIASCGTGGTDCPIYFNTSDQLLIVLNNTTLRASTQVFRDPSAWFHLHIVLDTNNTLSANSLGAASSRLRAWVNNVEILAWSTNTTISSGATYAFNSAIAHQFGADTGDSVYSDGYRAETYFIDGTALLPTTFGQPYPTTGAWVPIAPSGLTYGTNGFYLSFSDNSALTTSSNVGIGKDSSGNGNYWVTNNISITAGVTNDSLVDSPTNYGTDTGAGGEVRGNYPTWNPLANPSGSTLTNANLDYSNPTAGINTTVLGSSFCSGGKFYAELTINSLAGSNAVDHQFGVCGPTFSSFSYSIQTDLVGWSFFVSSGTAYYGNNGSTNSVGGATTPTVGSVMQVAIDLTGGAGAGKIWFGVQNSWIQGSPSAGTSPTFSNLPAILTFAASIFGTGGNVSLNCGQRPFAYAAPAGYKALCTQNLPTPAIVNGASYMAATLYTGTGSSQSPANSQSNGGNNALGKTFYPDLTWIKSRSAATDHKLTDSVRGVTNALVSDSTAAETTDTNGLTAFSSTGFTVGSDTNYNNNTATYVAWQWNANSGSSSSNTSGTITSTVSANTTAGFSVVTFTMNGTTGATVGHGLGVAPQMIIIKRRDAVIGWATYHVSVGNGSILLLNATNAATAGNYWNSTSPTSSVFTLGTSASGANVLNSTAVAYCFAAVPGFSAFGSYTGNGAASGPFIWCNFLPRFLLVKRTDSTGNWVIIDTSRQTYNILGTDIWANLSNVEGTDQYFDVLSNGFKVRSTGSDVNASGGTYIYAAFAAMPFKYSRAR